MKKIVLSALLAVATLGVVLPASTHEWDGWSGHREYRYDMGRDRAALRHDRFQRDRFERHVAHDRSEPHRDAGRYYHW